MRECRKCGEYYNHCWCEADKLRTELEASKQREETLKQSIEGANDIIDKLDDEIKAKDKRIAKLEESLDSYADTSSEAIRTQEAEIEALEQRIADAPHGPYCQSTTEQGICDAEELCDCWKKA